MAPLMQAIVVPSTRLAPPAPAPLLESLVATALFSGLFVPVFTLWCTLALEAS